MKHIEIIAECGINHGGSLQTALAMVHKAKSVGADTVKFQLVDPDFYKQGTELYNIFKECWLPPSDHYKLKREAEKIGINYLCTPSDVNMAKALVEAVGVKRLKIASDSAKDLKLIQYVEQNRLPYLISTGHIGSANDVIEWSKNLTPEYATILHCVSKYPCPEKDAQLGTINDLVRNLYPEYNIGYSDHTSTLIPAVVAVGAGANVIEKHFKLDTKCVDASLSLFPDDFERMVNLIRQTEKML